MSDQKPIEKLSGEFWLSIAVSSHGKLFYHLFSSKKECIDYCYTQMPSKIHVLSIVPLGVPWFDGLGTEELKGNPPIVNIPRGWA